MSKIFAQQERIVPAKAEQIYAVLSDYKVQRPKILTPNFVDYRVEQGGTGTGTVVSYLLDVANRQRTYRMQVDEAVHGRVLTERDTNSSLVTTWALSPVSDRATNVRVTTEWDGKATGMRGFFERTFAPLGLRRIYASMLESLTDVLGVSHKEVTAVQDKEYSPAENAKFFLALFGLVVAVALGISYLQKK